MQWGKVVVMEMLHDYPIFQVGHTGVASEDGLQCRAINHGPWEVCAAALLHGFNGLT